MATDPAKQARIEEVRALLDGFAQAHLKDAPEIAGYVTKLWAKVGRKRTYIITGGVPEIWAAATVYVIARLNFLFDKSSPNYLPPEVICGYFGVRRNTAAARATEIEKACKLHMGYEGLCSQEISDSLTWVELPDGFIVTKDMAREMGLL